MPLPRSSLAAAGLVASLASSVSAQPPRFADLHRMLPWEPSAAAHAIAAGDVDGDGDLDFLLGYDQPSVIFSSTGQQNRLLLNAGSGRFTDATGNLPQILDSTRGLALGDVDGDGDLDALQVNDTGGFGPSGILLNDGTGVFSQAPAPLPVGSANPSGGAFGDVDGDGDLDVAVAGGSTGLRLLLNDGAGAFVDASAQVPPSSVGTNALALGDLDGDGDLDAFAAHPADRPLLNDGTGTFTLGLAPSPTAPGYTTGLALGDLDGDGDLDAVSARDGGCSFVSCLGAQNRLYRNGGSANFTDYTVLLLPAEVDRTTSVATGDVDGDGDLDLLFGNVGTCSANLGCSYGETRLYLNDGGGAFRDATSQVPEFDDWTHAVALADVDGDGDLDALIGTEGDEGLPNRLLLNDGSGVFVDASGEENPASPFETATRGIALGDLDGDGDLDALAGRFPTYYSLTQVSGVFLNDGDGHLLEAPVQPIEPVIGLRLALGDVDADGDSDAIAAQGFNGGSEPRLFLNDGAGGLTSVANPFLPLVFGSYLDIGLGDFDGDGDLDALFGMVAPGYNGSTKPSRVYFNNGAGIFFFLPSATPPGTFSVWALAPGDVDGDGDLDAYLGTGQGCVSSGCPGEQDRLLVNNGAGVFTYAPASQLATPLDPTFAAALGDVDGDGDLDALAGNGGFTTPYADRLYLNDGAGFLAYAPGQLPPDADATSVVALGDVDGDGDLDAWVGASPQNRLLLNGGSGSFTDGDASLPAVRGSASSIALGDLDGDGDLDGLLADSGEMRIVSNLTRQLTWRELPRTGKPLTFDIHGPAWGAWFLVASAGTGNTPLPPLGVIRLDLATLMPQFGGLLDAQGHVAVTYQVPAVPALVGQSLYWQAVVVGPARLTNLETTTFSNL
ncbi:MAG: VCBS repeat-containing protein [Planctomycetes bacterium]|nr:VCBS repeat-containing protein [Planctomycetota bacterium]